MKIYLSDIIQGSGLAAMGCDYTQVDVDGVVCVLYVCKERLVAEPLHRDLIVE